MSNLESKAFGVITCTGLKPKKVVYLEDAQKEIAEISKVRDVLGKKHNDLVTERNEALAKIEAVNDKIQAFEKWLALGTPFESAKFDHLKVLEEYRKFFEINFPRKEEEGCPPDRAYCGTDDSSGKKCQYFDDCKQPKEEAKPMPWEFKAKENTTP